MAKPFSRCPRRSTATSPSRAAGVHNPRPHRGVACTPAAAPVVVDPPHRQTPPPPFAYTLPPHRAGAGRLTTALVRARSAAPLPPHRRPTRRAQPRAARPPSPGAAPAPAPGATHHLHAVALGSADHVQQTRLPRQADPYANRVAPVQCAHRRFQCHPVLGGGQGIAVGAHHDPLAAAAAHPKPAVTVPADGAHPDRSVVPIRAAHHIRLEPRQFLGMQPRIHKP